MSFGQWIMVLSGGAVGAASLWVLAWARRGLEGAGSASNTATRTATGLVGLLVGYHLAAYGLPPGAMPLRLPPGRLWIGVVGAVIAVGASLVMDRVDRRAGADVA